MNEPTTLKSTPNLPNVGPNTRVYAIGDIHGRLDLLNQLLDTIAKDSLTAPEHLILVFLGDYIDRGPDSFGVMERLSRLAHEALFDRFEIHRIKGNHEHLMEQFLDGDSPAIWFGCGGMATLSSYNVPYLPDPDDIDVMRDALHRAMPESHRQFLNTLKSYHLVGNYAFVHAGVRPGVAFARQNPDDLMWIRQTFLDSHADFGVVVVHGHSPVTVPDVLANRIAIDTRAWASGTLTAVVLEGEQRRFLST